MEGGRQKAGYYIMVKDGKITGGDGEPEEALAVRGFHIRARWAALCNQSGAFYGSEGGRKRREGERAMRAAIERCAGRETLTRRSNLPRCIGPIRSALR